MVPAEPKQGDAFGRALQDRFRGLASGIVIERDDGFVDADGSDYFLAVEHDPLWPWIRPRLRQRVRYQDLATGWFPLLWASATELAEIAARHGWEVVATEPAGILYGAELRPA